WTARPVRLWRTFISMSICRPVMACTVVVLWTTVRLSFAAVMVMMSPAAGGGSLVGGGSGGHPVRYPGIRCEVVNHRLSLVQALHRCVRPLLGGPGGEVDSLGDLLGGDWSTVADLVQVGEQDVSALLYVGGELVGCCRRVHTSTIQP